MTKTKLALAIAFLMAAPLSAQAQSWGMARPHRTHASELAPLPSRTMLVGGRQARLPAKGKGDPKASAFGVPLRPWGAGRGGPRGRNRYFYFFSLASPLALVPEAARAVSHGQRADIEWQT